MKATIGIAAAACAVAFVGCERDFALVDGGMARAALVATGDKLVDADLAVFTNAVSESTGVALPIIGADDKSWRGNRIAFRVNKRDLFHEDDWAAAFSDDGRTLTVDGSKHSCRWALNGILERELGVVYCFPGADGAHYPRTNRLALALAPRSGTASYKVERNMYREDSAWERCLGGKEQRVDQFYNHNLWRIFPTAKYGEDPWREKLMPMKNGKRAKPKNFEEGWQPCFSAPEAVTEAAKNVRAYLDAHPDESVFSISVNDNQGYCECDACKAMNGGTFDEPCKYGAPKSKSRSLVYFTWANKLAAELEKTHPHVALGLLAYNVTIDPPPFRLHHNLLPFLCASVYQNHNERIWNKRFALMKAWSDKVDAFGLWDYAYGMRSYAPPRVYMGTVAKYLALKNTECPSFNAYFGEGSSFYGEGPKRWLYYKLLFDSKLDVHAALDRWYRACCGDEAAPYLKEYYDLWEKFWTGEEIRKTAWYKSIDNGYCDFNSASYLFALDDKTLARADELMAKAIAAAKRSGDARQKIRAGWLEDCHAYYRARIVLRKSYLEKEPTMGVKEPPFTAAETAAGIRRLPEFSQAQIDAAKYAKRVADARKPESWRWGRGVIGSFLSGATLDSSLESWMVSFCKHADAPEVKAAIADALADKRTSPRFRKVLKSLADGAGGPDAFAATKNGAKDCAPWLANVYGVAAEEAAPTDGGPRMKVTGVGGWCAVGRVDKDLPSGKYMLFGVRVENCGKHEYTIRICHNASGTAGTSRLVKVKPGEKKEMAVPLESRGGAKFYVIFNGMQKDDVAFVDKISLRSME